MTDYKAAGILVERQDAVLTITLNRPDVRNAQTPGMWRALAEVGRTLEPDVRIVVLKGAGNSFSAGLDRRMMTPEGIEGERTFTELAALDDDGFSAAISEYQKGFTWWRHPQFVSIVAVQGHAIGAGFQLALACDLRVVADDVRFSMKETALGLVPDLGGTKTLVETVGPARALEMCGTSRQIGADEAVATGIANAAVPLADLGATVDDLVAALLVPQHGAVSALKLLLQGAGEHTYDEQRERERLAQVGRFRSRLRG